MDALIVIAETAAAATPAIAAWSYAARGRRRLRAALRQPLFWDGGAPISLATINNELNGEGDMEGELRELLGGSGPLTLPELERAVAQLAGNPQAAKRLVLELATAVCLRGSMPLPDAPTGQAGMNEAVALMDRLAARQEALGFFGFIAALNGERPAAVPALLPIEALLPGGFPIGPPPDGEPSIAGPGGGVLGVLAAIGLGREGDWLPGVMRAVGDLVRERQVKKARENYHRALALLGRAAGEALRRRTPAGAALRRNVYSPLDAYRNLATRLAMRKHKRRAPGELLVPPFTAALHDEFRLALARATAMVADKCANLERTLLGKQGEAFAGEVLYKHRDSLLAGVDPAAFPLQPIDLAREAYRLAQTESEVSDQAGSGAG